MGAYSGCLLRYTTIKQVCIGIPRGNRPIYYIVYNVTISGHTFYRRRRNGFRLFRSDRIKKKLKFTRVRRTLTIGSVSYPGICQGRC